LYRAAWAMCGSREDAEDLVQETFVRVMARPRFLHSEDDLGYLLRTLRNTFVSNRRSVSRRPFHEALDERSDFVEDRASPLPAEIVEAREVYAAIAALPPKCRDALVAVDVAGLSYEEAARALRVLQGTITSRLYRARKLVARRLRGVPPEVHTPARRPLVASGRQLEQQPAPHAVP
jgi:RNA polymerase sigma-70 factor (ECF subfamily)